MQSGELCVSRSRSMNFAYLTVLESNLFASARASYTIYRRESAGFNNKQKNRGDTCSTMYVCTYIYVYTYFGTLPMPVNGNTGWINGDVTKSYTCTYIHADSAIVIRPERRGINAVEE